jgi:phosphoglycerol transferase MdoB-like AlkP superfamily enzyme
MFEYLLINQSLAFPLLDAISKPLQYDGMIEQFNKLDELVNLSGPKFVFAHFVIPHPPFLIDRNGTMQKKFSGAISDGNYFKGTNEDYQEGYREQVLYANQRIEQFIDHILSSGGPQPIIIIQGDHGSGLYLDNDSMAATCTRERFSILNAYYFPGTEDVHLYPGITPVNSFRLVLNAYFDTNLPLLEDVSYFSTLGKPFDFQEVSKDQLSQSCVP